jgi:hypothetical protein
VIKKGEAARLPPFLLMSYKSTTEHTYRNPVGRAISLHFLRSFSVFLRARYAQIAELALARSNNVNFMGSAR